MLLLRARDGLVVCIMHQLQNCYFDVYHDIDQHNDDTRVSACRDFHVSICADLVLTKHNEPITADDGQYDLYKTMPSSPTSLVCDLNRTPNCYGKTWRLLCPFFKNLHLWENLARDCFTSTASTVTNSVQNISLTVYVIVTNTRLQPLSTTFYNSMLVCFSLLKI